MNWRGLRLCTLLILSAPVAQAGGGVAAAGRIDYAATGGSCSGVLIAPDIVATAAHCIPDGSGGQDIVGVTFVPSPHMEPVQVIESFTHPLYDSDSPRPEWRFRFDLAIFRLSESITTKGVEPVALGEDAVPGESLFLVSWRASDSPAPRQRSCPVLSVGVEGLVTLGCDVNSGESGAPLFRRGDDGGLELVAIVSSRSHILNQPIAQASNVRLRIPPLLDLAARDQGS